MVIKASPDLLFATPSPRLDLQRVRRVVAFVYAAGDSGGALGEVLERVKAPVSSFEPACFSRDIFIEELCRGLFEVSLLGHDYELPVSYATQITGSPPKDPADSEFRRAILQELIEQPQLATLLEDLYVRLGKLKERLVASDPSNPVQSIRRRLDLLEDLRGVFTQLESFAGCSSGLGRLARWGELQRARGEYRHLEELLDFEGNLSLMDLRVQVGADGRLRGFEVVSLQENVKNHFYLSPLKRWFNRFAMWLRGYRFGEHELLSRMVDSVFAAFEAEVAELLQLQLDVGLFVGQLQFRARAQAAGLEVCGGEVLATGAGSELAGLFNPLLLASGVQPIPCGIKFGGARKVLVVTGPNSGGKTRLLQSLAFAQLLVEGGWFVPAHTARLERAGGLFASLIEEPAAGQREGRLGSELLRIRRVFEHARPGALVLLDELCSGTNPSEGEQLFQLVIELLYELCPRAFVTTHFLEFAERLEQTPHGSELGFLQVELDEHTLPTFGFIPGVAHTSLARETASRLGVTRDELMGLIRRHPALPNPQEKRALLQSAATGADEGVVDEATGTAGDGASR